MICKRVIAAALTAAFLAVGLVPIPAAAQYEQPKGAAEKREPTPGQIAARERQRKCAAEWKELKAAGNIPAGMTWPKFWSACNTRLKAQGQ